MDANGTRYQLLLDRDDWAACTDEQGRPLAEHWAPSPATRNESGLDWATRTRDVTLQTRVFQFQTSPYDDRLTLDRRRGAARDRYGNWYWISASQTDIRVQSAGTGRSAHFWAAGDGECEAAPRLGSFAPKTPPQPIGPLTLSGLTVTEDHYLVVGVLHPKGLLIFDLHATGAPRQLLWPDDVDFAPFDLAPRPGGGVWILDQAHKCYWGLDRNFNILRLDAAPDTITPTDFQPIDHSTTRHTATRSFPAAILFEAASPLAAIDPIAIDALPDGTVLILDNGPDDSPSPPSDRFSLIHRYELNQLRATTSTRAVLGVVDADQQDDFRLRGYDFAFVAGQDAAQPEWLGTLFVVTFEGNQSFAFNVFDNGVNLELKALADYYPMRLFGGKAIVTAGPQVYYDFGDGWLPLIAQKRPRYEPAATLLSFALDGREPGCVWHRVLIDGCVPPDTTVTVWSRTADERHQLDRAAWWPEPPLLRRSTGSELPFVPPATAADEGTWELLLQRAAGRYLQLKITLSGNGRSTPRLRALRAYYPRFSYLHHYLPAVYRDDEASASFLDRFLANTEGTLTTLEDQIANVQLLFDVRSAPAEVLDWLADWLGVVLDPAWDERRRRLFIRHAMEFFQYRGTARGLLLALHLALDDCVDESIFTQPLTFSATANATRARRLSPFRIVEKFRTRRTPPVVLGDPTEAEGLRVVTVAQQWTPVQGRDVLIERWQQAAHVSTPFPVRDPGGTLSGVWRSFARGALGFVPAAEPDTDRAAWQSFLARRYGTPAALNAAYGRLSSNQYPAFTQVPLPAHLPADGAPLIDWYEFEGTLLAMQRTAHRFTVLLPAPATLPDSERQRRLDIAARVVHVEKPAHTAFDVKFYWALFRVGEARLGEDTVIDRGGRAPELMPPFVVGRDYLSEGYLAPGHPYTVNDRLVLNRDRLSSDPASTHHI